MNHLNIILFLSLCFLFLLVGSCKDESTEIKDTIEVQYIEQICCGNLACLNENPINSSCKSYEDFLLRAVNLEQFGIPTDRQFGDTLRIEYRLLDYCEAVCEITCNRYNGIPIELITVE